MKIKTHNPTANQPIMDTKSSSTSNQKDDPSTSKAEENDKMEKKSIFWTTDEVDEKQEKEIMKVRSWRENFLDGHNKDPRTLANSLYPNPIFFTDKESYNHHFIPARPIRGRGVKVETDKAEPRSEASNENSQAPISFPNIFRALANSFVSDMKHAGLELSWNKSKCIHWVPDLRGHGRTHDARFLHNARIQFYCNHCIAAGRIGLIANGKFRTVQPDPNKLPDLPDFHLIMEEIYYHRVECNSSEQPTTALRYYQEEHHVVIPSGNDWVFSEGYSKMENKIQKHEKAGFTFCESLTLEEKKKLKEDFPELKKGTTTQHNWISFGELINYGQRDYKYDDRSYLLLPGSPLETILPWREHQKAMARLMYVLVSNLGIEEDVSPFLFDETKYRNMWTAKNKKKNYRDLHKDNIQSHISLKEVSALFGGNERVVCGRDPIHQYCHVDGSAGITMSDNLFCPGSLIVPLSSNGRQIYVRCPEPEQTLHIPYGSALVFKSDLPHGGITVRGGNGQQRVAIHGHLDSKKVSRHAGLLDLSELGNHYLPTQHLRLYTMSNRVQHIIVQYHVFRKRMEYFAESSAAEFFHHVDTNFEQYEPAEERDEARKTGREFLDLLNKFKEGNGLPPMSPTNINTKTNQNPANKKRKTRKN